MRHSARHTGFTLIEVMVVLLIIGIMASIVAPNIMGNQEDAKLQKAAVDIQQLESAVEMYKLKNSQFPTTEQGLEALVTEPTIEPLPRNYPQGGESASAPRSSSKSEGCSTREATRPTEVFKCRMFINATRRC